MEISIYFDGASKGNGGASGAGYYVSSEGIKCIKGYKFLGNQTNNQAEYNALILGLQSVLVYCNEPVKVYGDSKLVIEQMKGNWKVKAVNMVPLWKTAKELAKKFSDIEFIHIDRGLNTIADSLANKAVETMSNNECNE